MKKMIGLATLGLALVLTGCSESEMKGAELSKEAAGSNSEIPRVVLTPDAKPEPQKAGKTKEE